jgi:hypothetical protein
VKVGGHPMESVTHDLRKEKVGRSAKLYKRAPMCQIFKELGTALPCLVKKIARTPLPLIDRKQPPLKTNFYLFFTNEKL